MCIYARIYIINRIVKEAVRLVMKYFFVTRAYSPSINMFRISSITRFRLSLLIAILYEITLDQILFRHFFLT